MAKSKSTKAKISKQPPATAKKSAVSSKGRTTAQTMAMRQREISIF